MECSRVSITTRFPLDVRFKRPRQNVKWRRDAFLTTFPEMRGALLLLRGGFGILEYFIRPRATRLLPEQTTRSYRASPAADCGTLSVLARSTGLYFCPLESPSRRRNSARFCRRRSREYDKKSSSLAACEISIAVVLHYLTLHCDIFVCYFQIENEAEMRCNYILLAILVSIFKIFKEIIYKDRFFITYYKCYKF